MAGTGVVVIPEGTSSRRRRWPIVASLVVVVLAAGLVVGWQVLARAPRLAPGDFGQTDSEAVPESMGSVVTDPVDGTFDGIWSFRNTGPVAVTVRVPSAVRAAAPQQNQVVRSLALVPVDPDTGQVAWYDSVDEVRLAPGDEVGVRYALGAGCWLWAADIAYGASTAVLEVTALGVTRTVAADAGATSWVRWSHEVQPDGCP